MSFFTRIRDVFLPGSSPLPPTEVSSGGGVGAEDKAFSPHFEVPLDVRDLDTKANPDFAALVMYGNQPVAHSMPRNYQAYIKEGYRTNPTTYKAISYISRNGGAIPPKLYTDKTREKEIEDHPLLELLDSPNSDMSGVSYREAVMGFLMVAGNSYQYAIGGSKSGSRTTSTSTSKAGQSNGTGSGGGPDELWPLRPDWTMVVPDRTRGIVGYKYQPVHSASGDDMYAPGDVWHHKYWCPDDALYGLSPLEIAALLVDQQTAASKWNLALLQNWARMPGAWVVPTPLEKNVRDKLEQKLQEKFAGYRRAGAPPVLDGGLTWQSMGVAPADMDWIPGMTWNAGQIATIFGLAPMVVGDTSATTYDNFRQAEIYSYSEAIFPDLDKIYDGWNRWLVPKYPDLKKMGAYLYYDKESVEVIQEMLQAQKSAQSARATEMYAGTQITLNEARELQGMPPIEGGDRIKLGNTLIPLEVFKRPVILTAAATGIIVDPEDAKPAAPPPAAPPPGAAVPPQGGESAPAAPDDAGGQGKTPPPPPPDKNAPAASGGRGGRGGGKPPSPSSSSPDTGSGEGRQAAPAKEPASAGAAKKSQTEAEMAKAILRLRDQVETEARTAASLSALRTLVAEVEGETVTDSPPRKYSPDQPRADNGQFGEGDGSSSSGGAPTVAHTIDEAIALLGAGKGVMFERPTQVVTLLHELNKIAQDAKAKGEKAPVYDLCNVSVPGTNLFCADNVGIPRDQMPQLSGKPVPGSPADALPKNAAGEVDLGPAFREYLAAQGHTIEDTTTSAGLLRASQNQLDGVKVSGMMAALEQGRMSPAPIFTSADNYVVDGHHRWAANVGYSYEAGKDVQMPIARVDMPILQTLQAANQFASAMGIPQASVSEGRKRAALAPAEEALALSVLATRARGHTAQASSPSRSGSGSSEYSTWMDSWLAVAPESGSGVGTHRGVKYSPDQSRADNGQFGEGGGSSPALTTTTTPPAHLSPFDKLGENYNAKHQYLEKQYAAWRGDLSTYQQAGLRTYGQTITGSDQWNPLMRAGAVPPGSHTERLIKSTAIATEYGTAPCAMTVYRGMQGDQWDSLQKNVGGTFTDKAFTSTTLMPEIADIYTTARASALDPNVQEEDTGIRATISLPKGSPGAYLGTEFGTLDTLEMLLPPNAQFKVLGTSAAPDGSNREVSLAYLGVASSRGKGRPLPDEETERPPTHGAVAPDLPLPPPEQARTHAARFVWAVGDLVWKARGAKYSPDQERDDHGRFGSGGGEGASGTPTAPDIHPSSPNYVPGVNDPQIKALAAGIVDAAAAHEPGVTADLQRVVAQADNAGRLTGLDFRLKGDDSLRRKIVSDAADKLIPPQQAAAQIKDALRYTSLVNSDDSKYVTATQAQIDALKGAGYSVDKLKNSWGSSGYQGINAQLKTPDGFPFELQFHTPESLVAKDSAHVLYNDARRVDAGSPASLALQSQMSQIFASVPTPSGASTVHKARVPRGGLVPESKLAPGGGGWEYYGLVPSATGDIVTLYRLLRNARGLMVVLEGANAQSGGWRDCHGALEMIEQDPAVERLTVAEAARVAVAFGVSLSTPTEGDGAPGAPTPSAHRKYSPEQERDDHGRFGSGDDGGTPTSPAASAFTPQAMSVKQMQTTGARLGKMLDDQNLRERDYQSKQRIMTELAATLGDTPDFQKLVVSMQSQGLLKGCAAQGIGANATEQATATLVNSWARTNVGSPLAVAIQQAAIREFGTNGTTLVGASSRDMAAAHQQFGDVMPGLQTFLRAQYDATQSLLADQGITSVPLYRSMLWNSAAAAPDGATFDGQGTIASVAQYPLSSWSASPDIAQTPAWDLFGPGGASGVPGNPAVRATIMATVPASRIVSTGMTGFGCKRQSEMTVLGSGSDPVVWYGTSANESITVASLARASTQAISGKTLAGWPGSGSGKTTRDAIMLDETPQNADWAKTEWDLPERDAAQLDAALTSAGMTAAAFLRLPVCQANRARLPWLDAWAVAHGAPMLGNAGGKGGQPYPETSRIFTRIPTVADIQGWLAENKALLVRPHHYAGTHHDAATGITVLAVLIEGEGRDADGQ